MAVGRPFAIDCINISVRGQKHQHFDEPYFSGPGSINADAEGHFRFRLYDTRDHAPNELIRLSHSAANETEPMAIDADDYQGTAWTGAWFFPKIHLATDTGRCVVEGEFPQLSTHIPWSDDSDKPLTTTIYYAGTLGLPMSKGSHSQTIRDGEVERVTPHWDRTELEFDGARISISVDLEKGRTVASTTYRGTWQPPFCEVGLRDSIAFVSANDFRPRVTVRGLKNDAIVFLRWTSNDLRTGMPRPVGAVPPNSDAFWNVFLAFLNYCDSFGSHDVEHAFFSSPLSRTCSELVPASTGTVHGFILSLVVAIEALVTDIVPPSTATKETAGLQAYINAWTGDERTKKRAINILNSFLNRTSTNEHLRSFVKKHVVTEVEQKLWNELRQKVAHGKLVDYEDEQLLQKRLKLVTMFYRLAMRRLNYQGAITDYGVHPPQNFQFQWDA